MHRRAPACELDKFAWNLRRVPRELAGDPPISPHPSFRAAIFVVHGIGTQLWTETAAGLHSGFEDALEAIANWQRQHGLEAKAERLTSGHLPPPFALDGYWGDYDDLKATFPDDWACFEERERKFFSGVWQRRAVSAKRTYVWFLQQQIRLLSLRTLKEVGILTWLLYIPLQVVAFTALTLALVRKPALVTRFLNDVRLYLDPRGIVERAIVQRIDQRVGEKFMKLIGLGWDFRPLAESSRLRASGSPVQFERVVWVAHSLGTVISYNVLSDLLHLADFFEARGDSEQKAGVTRFRAALARFVTLGSPLDKVAFLFPDRLTPWPGEARANLLDGGDRIAGDDEEPIREWWVNFYHRLDPISGSLTSPLITHGRPPANIHGRRLFSLPGLAHVSYWTDLTTLRFVLGRAYGKELLEDRLLKPWPAWLLGLLQLISYAISAAIIVGGAWAIVRYGPELIRSAF
jgi:hypothetical protein